MKQLYLKSVFLILIVVLGSCSNSDVVYDLSCNYQKDPLGVDGGTTRLGWKLSSDKPGAKQSAYRIIVTNEDDELCWDSKKVETEQSILVPYSGNPLKSSTRYNWKIKVWNENGRVTAWSNEARWTTGILSQNEWKAKWIGLGEDEMIDAAPFFRKEFEIDKRIESAHAYVSGLGYYELSLNGKKLGDHILDPAQTDYEKRVFYTTYDITDLINQGRNALGIILGNGWYHQQVAWGGRSYGAPRAIVQVKILFEDGNEKLIYTDESWKAITGPIVYNSIYKGEVYDARLELEDWDKVDYNESDWKNSVEVSAPGGSMVSQSLPPIREIERIEPIKVFTPEAGMMVFDLGQNISGYSEISLTGKPGTHIKLRFAETIDNQGYIDVASTGVKATTSEQVDQYICKGGGLEKYKPRFTYHGFRYIEITADPGIPEDLQITGIVVHTNSPKAGEFECSDTLLNRIFATALWTIRGNMHGLLTDCPHRERCGWLGDAHIAAEATIYNLETADFWIKYIRDIETSLDKGLPTNVAPGLRIKWVGRADWGAAVVLLPWYLYQYYGDLSMIKEQYPNMKRYIEHLLEISEDGIVTNGFGDWYDPPAEGPEAISIPTPKYTSTGITTTGLYYISLDVMIKACELLGNEQDIEFYKELKMKTKEAFNRHFYSSETAYGSQTANTLALKYKLCEEENRDFVVQSLIKDIQEHDFHFTTGMHGAKHLNNILSEYGYGDVAYKVMTNKTFPSIPYLFSLGATTNWENWSTTPNGNDVPRSKSHPMNSGYATWFYQSLAGIKPHPDSPAFKKIILEPDFTVKLDWTRASYQSPYGKISSSWERVGNTIDWEISIPPNTTAEIRLSNTRVSEITGSINYSMDELSSIELDTGSYLLLPGNYQLKLIQPKI